MADFFFGFNEEKTGLVVTYRYGLKGNVVFPSTHEIDGISYPVTKIGGENFRDQMNDTQGISKLTSVVIPDSVTEIESGAFSRCETLTSVIVPDSVEKIGNDTFLGCSALSRITLSNSLVSIGHNCFKGCLALEKITLPESLKLIGVDAFAGANRRAITFPNETLRKAFWNCYDPPRVEREKSQGLIDEDKDFADYLSKSLGTHHPQERTFDAIILLEGDVVLYGGDILFQSFLLG